MSLPSFSVRRGVTTVMIFLAIAVIGLVSMSRLPLDLFPDIEMPTISVITYYFGASAADVEDKVTDVLEEYLAVTTDLEEMSSLSAENVSVVTLQFAFGTNLDEAMNDIRAKLDFAARDLPDDAETPILFRLNFNMLPVVMIGVTSDEGDVHEHASYIEERIMNRIERLEGVATVQAMNQRNTQVLVDVDRQRLEDYGISLQQIAAVIQMENLTLPAGALELGRRSYTIRVPGEYATVDELRNVVVSQHEGSMVLLQDVATIHEDFEDSDAVARLGGRPMLGLMVMRESGANTVEVAAQVKALVEQLERDMPEHLHVTTIMDMSQFIVRMIDHLTAAVYGGGVIVIIVVFLFLRRFRTTLIVVITIPTCLIAVFAMLWFGGFTINMISLASIAMAIGVVVDNTIVVIENIVRHRAEGEDADEAATKGAEEVGDAVMASSLTNIAVFAPIVFVGGMIGIVFNQLAFVIIVAITLSLLVALMLGPMLASRLLRTDEAPGGGRLDRVLGRPVEWMEQRYGRLITRVTSSRRSTWSVIVVSLVVFVLSLVLTGLVGQDFMPVSDGGMVLINYELTTGTRTGHTVAVAERIEQILKRRVPEAELTFIKAGQNERDIGVAIGDRQGDNVGMVAAVLTPLSKRDRTSFEIAAAIRPEIEQIPGIVSITIGGGNMTENLGKGGARPLTIEVYADNNEVARQAAVRVREIFESLDGPTEITTDLMDNTPELRVVVDRAKAARLGVPMASIAMAVRTGLYGQPVSRYRGGDDDVEIFLRLEPEDRSSLESLRALTIPSLAGAQVRLDSVADIEEAATPVEIRRLDGDRAIRVMADVQGRALSEVAADLEKAVADARQRGEIPDDVETRFTGDIREQREMVADLSVAMLLAILLVYMVMAAQFESYLDPLVIMFSIPFAITGVFLALILTGTTLSLTSFLGMIILVGIVVNNAIVLVDYINQMRRKGKALTDAVTTGGMRRLRPVLMTSLTTIGGMLPLALATGEGSEMWRPMGIAVIGGLLVSMLVTLVLIPALYMATERLRTVKRIQATTPR